MPIDYAFQFDIMPLKEVQEFERRMKKGLTCEGDCGTKKKDWDFKAKLTIDDFEKLRVEVSRLWILKTKEKIWCELYN